MTDKERLILDKGYWIEYQERIAIMVIDGGVDEAVATERAQDEVVQRYNLVGPS